MFNERLFVLVDSYGKYGFVDSISKSTIPCEWDYFYNLNDDNFILVSKDDKCGILDATGEIIVPCEFDALAYTDGHIFKIKNGYLTIEDLEGNRVF